MFDSYDDSNGRIKRGAPDKENDESEAATANGGSPPKKRQLCDLNDGKTNAQKINDEATRLFEKNMENRGEKATKKSTLELCCNNVGKRYFHCDKWVSKTPASLGRLVAYLKNIIPEAVHHFLDDSDFLDKLAEIGGAKLRSRKNTVIGNVSKIIVGG